MMLLVIDDRLIPMILGAGGAEIGYVVDDGCVQVCRRILRRWERRHVAAEIEVHRWPVVRHGVVHHGLILVDDLRSTRSTPSTTTCTRRSSKESNASNAAVAAPLAHTLPSWA